MLEKWIVLPYLYFSVEAQFANRSGLAKNQKIGRSITRIQNGVSTGDVIIKYIYLQITVQTKTPRLPFLIPFDWDSRYWFACYRSIAILSDGPKFRPIAEGKRSRLLPLGLEWRFPSLLVRFCENGL